MLYHFCERGPRVSVCVQVETFGVSINAYGTCFYGLQLEAVMDRVKDAISLDHLSRLLADVQTDSSEVRLHVLAWRALARAHNEWCV